MRRGGADEWADAEAAALRALGQLRDEIERLDAVAEVGELGPARLPCVLLETVFRNLVANAVEAGPGKAGGAGLGSSSAVRSFAAAGATSGSSFRPRSRSASDVLPELRTA